MIQSMTGFAIKTFVLTTPDEGKSNVSISLKSFNSRFFEATCRLPYPLLHLETEFIKQLKKKLYRGHVYLTINMDNLNIFKGTVEPSFNIISGYINAIQQMQDRFNLKQPVSVDVLLQLPNVFSVEEHGINDESAALIFEHIDQLIDQIITMRGQEGQEIKNDLQKRIEVMQQEIDIIEKKSQELIEVQKEKVNMAMQELSGEENALADMRKNTLYALLDKLDIHEEIVRFKSHLLSMKQQLETANIEKGKRLDFTLQELAREVNTIAAKCSDAIIGSHAINMKVEIEKSREQTQNIV
ncbi:MAG: YicC/YloC family endoribonuclease [bacterium]|nr:YicC/YloC family endoribonuclease [bacterium]